MYIFYFKYFIDSRNSIAYFISEDSGENEPRHSIPSLVAELKTHKPRFGSDDLKGFESNQDAKAKRICGFEARRQRNHASCICPMEGGVVQNWDAADELWTHAFEDLLNIEKGTAAESQILLTEPPLNPTNNTYKSVEYMFESMNFGAVNVSSQSMLVLYAQGLLTGLVIECGEGVSHVVPVFEGFVPHHTIKRHPVAGRTITNYLAKLLQLRGYHYHSISDLETVRDVKEKLCYAACDLELERRLARETTVLVENYTLPDGETIKIGQERFEATEAFFDPSLVDMESKGLSDLVFDTIQETDIDCRLEYYEHIVLS